MVLRGFCSDLFVHGRGGGKYDRFVDQLALQYLKVKLPKYVVASRTRHLFPEKVADISHSVELASKVKEMTSKTELFLGQGIFTAEEEGTLAALCAQRVSLRAELQRTTNPDARSAASHALNTANRAVRGVVENGSLRTHIEAAAANETALARWSFREFPFFMFTCEDSICR
jgi:hypothetical protein